MDHQSAESVAKILGGIPWQSGGNIWLVVIERADRKVVVIGDEGISLYASGESLGGDEAAEASIDFR